MSAIGKWPRRPLVGDSASQRRGWATDPAGLLLSDLGVGCPLFPPMPVEAIAALTNADLRALFAWLQSIKPIANQVPQPSPPK